MKCLFSKVKRGNFKLEFSVSQLYIELNKIMNYLYQIEQKKR